MRSTRRALLAMGAALGLAGCQSLGGEGEKETNQQVTNPADSAAQTDDNTEDPVSAYFNDAGELTAPVNNGRTVTGQLAVENGKRRPPFDTQQRFQSMGKYFEDSTGASIGSFGNPGLWSPENDATTISAETANVYRGTQSLAISSKATANADIYRQLPEAIDLRKRDLSIALRMETSMNTAVGFGISAISTTEPYTSVSLSRFLKPSHHREWIRVDLGSSTETMSDASTVEEELSAIDRLRIRLYTAENRSTSYYDDMRFVPSGDGAKVIFIFDDAQDSIYNKAFPLMEQYGIPGVLPVIPNLIGEAGFMTQAQIDEAFAAGWEIIGHSERSFLNDIATESEAKSEFESVKSYLLSNGYAAGSRFFVWPYGHHNAEQLKIASEYWNMAFAADADGHGNNPHTVTSPLSIHRSRPSSLKRLKADIDRAVRFNEVVPITIHNISKGGPTSMSSADFEELLSYVNQLGDAVDVWQISDWWSYLN